MTPKGALLYGEQGQYIVWETMPTGMYCWQFSDEYLAMQYAVSVGSQVRANPFNF